MGYLQELLSQVASSLLRNKLRSFLTMAGIAWGVASIVLIVAMGDGFKQGQRNNTKQLGENIVLLFPGRTEKQVGGQRAGRRIRFTYDDIRRYPHGMLPGEPGDRRIAEWRQGGQPIQQRIVHGERRGAAVFARSARSRSRRAASWRIPTKPNAERVAVLGDNVRKQLFGERPVAPGDRRSS